MGSFAKIRASFAVNEVIRFICERNLLRQTVHGELFYIGSTEATGPWPVHRGMIIRDNILLFASAEGIQLMQLASGSRVHNNVMFVAAMDYRSPFQAFQDTGVQLSFIEGGVTFDNNIIWGWAATGLHLFCNDGTDQDVPFGDGIITIKNNAFLGGRKGNTYRLDDSFTLPTKCVFEGNDIINNSRTYEIDDLNDYHCENAQNTTPVFFIGETVVDDSYPFLSGSTSTVKYFDLTRAATDVPEFVNSGFDYIDADRVYRWSETYGTGTLRTSSTQSIDPSALSDGGSLAITVADAGEDFVPGDLMKISNSSTKYFYCTVNTYSGTTLNVNNISERTGSGASTSWEVEKRIPYTVGDFVWLAENALSLDYHLYKCIVAHDSNNDRRPDQDTTNWSVVAWDENGKSSEDPAYNGTPYTYDFMDVAGDFRLVKGSYHHLLGRGLSCNEQRDDQTKMGWQWAETTTGTIRDIPGAYNITLTLSDYSYLKSGRYYRFWVEKMKSDGTFEVRKYSPWQQVS
jgi:uncharacterized protein YqfB (UPF0267 family)